tara:strand:+ start:2920 stop:3816 length:897 start_codon:yes stop_codon:yes gene_type:complete
MKIVVPQKDFVQSTRYALMCDVAHSYTYYKDRMAQHHKLTHTKFLRDVEKTPSNVVSVYCKTDHIQSVFNILSLTYKKIVLFTGCSDFSVDHDLFSRKPNNVIKWFGENVNYKDDNLIPTPMGSLVGTWIGNENIDPIYSGETFVKIPTDDKEKENKNLMLLSFSLNTNFSSRTEVYNKFKNEKYVTNLCSTDSSKKCLTEDQFCREIYNHKFVFSPEGNGIDCGRTWVSIQLGSIPIVKRSVITEYVEDKLPIFLYNDLNEITQESLENFKPKCTNYDILSITYYEKLVNFIKDYFK